MRLRPPLRCGLRLVAGYVHGVLGAVIILVVLFVIGPIALFVGGAIWSAVFGWVTVDDADRRAGAATPAES
jgi:hypothetical protein